MDATFRAQLNDLFSLLHDPTHVNRTVCISRVDHYKFYQWAVIPAILISLAFSALKQRRQKLTDILYGRPGLIHPMDALTSGASISYVCAFGATVFLVYDIIFRQKLAFKYEGPLALKTLIVIVSMIWYGFVYFPIFAALTIRSIFSYAVGSIYVWVFSAVFYYKSFECDVRWEVRLLLLARDLPNLACLAYLSISLPVRFVLALKTKTYFVSAETVLDAPQTLNHIRNSYQGLHVAKLLRKPDPQLPTPETKKEKIKRALVSLVETVLYKKEKGFRYSTRIQSVLVVGTFLLYIATFDVMTSGVGIYDVLIKRAELFLSLSDIKLSRDEQFDFSKLKTWLTLGYFLLIDGRVCFIVSMVIALVIGLVMILHMLSSFRTNLLALYRGDHSHIPERNTRSNASLMVGCMRYAGYQVGYIAWAYAVQFLVLYFLGLIIAFIAIMTRGGVSSWFVNKVLQVWPLFVWTFAINILQILLAKFLFLQRRGDTLSIDNRRFFFIFTYFVFFFNIFLGIVSCLMRIIKAIILGALFLSRLDHSSLTRRFQYFDPGFAAYVGFIHVENEHTHPVMIVFIRLMLMNLHFRRLGKSRSFRHKKGRVDDVCIDMDLNNTDDSSPEIKRKRYKATFNWLLFYTLINNPQIRIFRKGYVQALMKAVRTGVRIPVSDLPTADLSHLHQTSEENNDGQMKEIKVEPDMKVKNTHSDTKTISLRL